METKTKWMPVHELFADTAERLGSRTAVESAGRPVSYRELEERANNLANYLIANGAERGAIVAVVADDVVDVLTALIGTLKACGAFVPIDPGLPEKRIEAMLAQSAPGWFFIDSKHFGKLAAAAGQLPAPARVVCMDGETPAGAHDKLTVEAGFDGFRDTRRPARAAQPDEMCSIYFTSGSTGRPKGIAGRLKGIDHFVRWEIATTGAGEGTRVSQLTSPSFDGFLKDVFVPLCSGGTVCVPPGREVILDGPELVRWLDAERVNILHCVPSVFRTIINAGLTNDLFADLRHVLLAGEPLMPADVGRWSEVFADRVQLINIYGPTETTVTKLYYRVSPSDAARRTIPIGKPMEGAAALIMDAKGRPCPPGTVGEIYIRTPFRSLGYYKQPELTGEVFVPNPFGRDPNDLIYKTGDFGRVAEDGNFEFLGRRDHQVKIRGNRVELGEVENVLRLHPSVRDAAVVDRDDSGGNKYLCAYVVGDSQGAHELREFLGERLPDYMLPSAFVEMESLPRTFNGKLDRRALPSPEQMRAARGDTRVAPRTPVEEKLAAIWAHVLGVEGVGVEENFFELGGHSLLATQVMTRVRDAFEVELPLRHLFEGQTIARLAERVEEALGAKPAGQALPLAPATRDGDLPLSSQQQRMWLVNELEPNSPAYNIHINLHLQGPLNVAAFTQSLKEIVRRHESLRTSFPVVGGRPRQVIAGEPALPLAEVDLSELPDHLRDPVAARLVREESRRPFDLTRGPLIRARRLKLGPRSAVTMLTMHHIISDGWSLGVLERELGPLHAAYASGRPSPLAELTVQYADYAAWQRSWMQGEALETQLDYWRRQLAGAPDDLRLPADRPRGAAPVRRGAITFFAPGREVSARLRELSRREGATPFMTLLAAFDVLLHRYTGQDDIVVGSPIANRMRVETEALIGCFTNTLALRTDLSGNPTFRELLARVREVTLGAYAHQDAPYDQVVTAVRRESAARPKPLFRVWFVLQNARLGDLSIPGVGVKARGADQGTAQFDLTLMMWDDEKGFRGRLLYDSEMFEAATAAELVSAYEAILAEVAEDAGRRVLDLRLGGEPRASATDAPAADEFEDQFLL